jgi:beta-lactamase class A
MPERYYYMSPRRRRKQRRRRLLIVFTFLFLGPALIFFSLKLFLASPFGQGEFLNPLRSVVEEKTSPIGAYLSEELLPLPGSYGVFVKNLKTGETYSFNKERVFDSASLYKLWVMAVATKDIEAGNLSKDEVLSLPKKELDKDLGLIDEEATPSASVEESIEPSPSESPSESPAKSPSASASPEPEEMVSIKAGDALARMITFSDNYSALLLVDRLGAKKIAGFLRENGFSGSSFSSPPKTTARDIALFFEKLYKKEFTASERMIELLKKQEINDRISKYLPKEVESAHKTGELGGNKHDAGIVFGKNGDYIIVVLSDTNNARIASENIANFSKKVYDYFN